MPKRRSISDRVTDSFRVLTELDLSHAYERQAGTVTLIVLAAAVGIAVLAGTRAARVARTTSVDIELPSSGGLAAGDPVRVRGAQVGRVRAVRLLSPGRVRVSVTVGEAYAPRADATAAPMAVDLVGNVALDYHPGRAAEPLPPGVPVAGTAAATLNERLIDLRDQAAELAIRLRDFDPQVLMADVHRTREALARAQAAASAFPADSLAVALAVTSARGDSVMASLAALGEAFPREAIQAQRESLATNAAALFAEVGEVQASLDRLREQVARGEGNFGRLRHDGTFRAELDSARTSLRLLLEKFGGRRSPPPPR